MTTLAALKARLMDVAARAVTRARGFRRRLWVAIGFVAICLIGLSIATLRWQADIGQSTLDPHTPFQTYRPPAAPRYAERQAWALLPDSPERWTTADSPIDVFFIHPTTFDGGADWNGPIDDRGSLRRLTGDALPNYAGPYFRIARLFAPKYRQASLFAMLVHRDDAKDARKFAYKDVAQAFDFYLSHYNRGRPFAIVGVEQGGSIADRLVSEVIDKDANLRARLVAAYMIDTAVAAEAYSADKPVPACARRAQAGCAVGYLLVDGGDELQRAKQLERALIWTPDKDLTEANQKMLLCVNPLTGSVSEPSADERQSLGAANATGLEWGARPAFLSRQLGATCRDNVLMTTRPKSGSLQDQGGWIAHKRVNSYNLFYADLEEDLKKRTAAYFHRSDTLKSAPPIDTVISVTDAPVRVGR